MVGQIVVTALIAAGNLWPSLAASQTMTPLWLAAPEPSADASTRCDDATCREATFATDSAQPQKSSKPSANNSPSRLVGHVHRSGGRKSTWGRPSGHRLCRPTPRE